MIVYEVKKPIKNAAIGLERQVGQTVNDAELRSALPWRDTLIVDGAIVPTGTTETAEPPVTVKKGVKHA